MKNTITAAKAAQIEEYIDSGLLYSAYAKLMETVKESFTYEMQGAIEAQLKPHLGNHFGEVQVKNSIVPELRIILESYVPMDIAPATVAVGGTSSNALTIAEAFFAQTPLSTVDIRPKIAEQCANLQSFFENLGAAFDASADTYIAFKRRANRIELAEQVALFNEVKTRVGQHLAIHHQLTTKIGPAAVVEKALRSDSTKADILAAAKALGKSAEADVKGTFTFCDTHNFDPGTTLIQARIALQRHK